MATPLRILFVERRQSILEKCLEELTNAGYEAFWVRVETETDFLARLSGIWDVILAQADIPGFELQRALYLMKERGLDIPMVIVANESVNEKLEAFKNLGARGFVFEDRLSRLRYFLIQFLRDRGRRGDVPKTDRAGKEFEDRFEALFDDSPEIIMVIHRENGKILKLNESVRRILGYPVRSLIHRHFSLLLPPGSNGSSHELLEETCGEDEALKLRPFRHADGSTLHMNLKASLIPWDSEPAILVVVRNRIVQEPSDALSQERYWRDRRLLESNPDPIVVYNKGGQPIYINPAFTQVFGWTREAELGEDLDLFVPEDLRAQTREMMGRLLDGESFSNVESLRYTRDGKAVSVCISGANYPDRDGKPMGWIIALRDIREQKELELQLRQAQKMEALATLAGGVAHDFNNILQGILGYAQLARMKKKKGDPDYDTFVKIEGITSKGRELTRQFLTIGRKIDTTFIPLSLNERVKAVESLLSRTIPKMIDVQLTLAEDAALVNADAGQIDQVLMNLGINARDAMPEGGRLVFRTQNARLEKGDKHLRWNSNPGDYVRLSVSDTGCGMSNKTIERIFEPFFTTKKKGQGTGLGLSMAYAIVKNHGGFIHCSSRLGKGTTFDVYLPMLRSETVHSKLTAFSGKEALTGGEENILMVDDEDHILNVSKEVLAKYGYNVVTATTGEEAIYKYIHNPIDLIVLDIGMPGMGGVKCLEKLLSLDERAKVLVCSGYPLNGRIKKALAMGAHGYLAKPYNSKDLLKTVRKILDGKESCQVYRLPVRGFPPLDRPVPGGQHR